MTVTVHDDAPSEPPPPYEAIAGPSSLSPAATQGQWRSINPSDGRSVAARGSSLDHEKQEFCPELTPAASTSSASPARRVGSQNPLNLPCVVPQLAGGRIPFMTPFLRAYAPDLASHGISKTDFVAFIDGLNEAFLGSPVSRGTNVVGMVLSQSYGLSSVQLAGGIVEVVSGFGSAAVSYSRTKMYVKAMNERLFNPAGLHVNILTTEKMLEHIGFPEQEFPLAPLRFDRTTTKPVMSSENDQAAPGSKVADESIKRRMQTLEGYCLPLDHDVPPSVQPDSLLRRMGNAQAARLTQEHENKNAKGYEKAVKAEGKSSKKAEKDQRKAHRKINETDAELDQLRGNIDSQVQKIEGKMSREQETLERRMTSPKIVNDPKQQRKAQRDYEKEMTSLREDIDKERKKFDKEKAKLDKDGEKEGRKAEKKATKESGKSEETKLEKKESKSFEKMRWVVVSRVKDGEDKSEDSMPERDEEVEGEGATDQQSAGPSLEREGITREL